MEVLKYSGYGRDSHGSATDQSPTLNMKLNLIFMIETSLFARAWF
jgi:hypothetical protein